MVCTSHPLAAEAGRAALEAGGSAADAAVAAAAVLGVVDPMSTSIGGDGFAVLFDAKTRSTHVHVGVGGAPAAASIDALRSRGHAAMPARGWLPVTVPGVVEHWAAVLQRAGRLGFDRALRPAIDAARGYRVTRVVARDWERARPNLEAEQAADPAAGLEALLTPPSEGDTVTLPALARTLEQLAEHGPDVFYRGAIAERIAEASAKQGGWLTAEDLDAHHGAWVAPLEGVYRGHRVVVPPAPGQGVVTLRALGMLETISLRDLSERDRVHFQIEAIKQAFVDALAAVGDPAHAALDGLLTFESLEAAGESLPDPAQGATDRWPPAAGPTLFAYGAGEERADAAPRGDTVHVSVVDAEGNACALINSVYMHFGAMRVVDGVVMQNRGHLFAMDPAHPGALGPGRRCYHTIVPMLVFRHDAPWIVMGLVGGPQQPQGHVQVLSRMIDLGASIEEAVAAPRFRWNGGRHVQLEEGIDEALREGLASVGHLIGEERALGFGGAQAIAIDPSGLHAASDPRKDGRDGAGIARVTVERSAQ